MTIEIHKRDLAALARLAGDVDKTEFARLGAVAAQRPEGGKGPVLLVACNGRSAVAIPCTGSIPTKLSIPQYHAEAGARLSAKDGLLRIDLEPGEDRNPPTVHIHGDGESLYEVNAKEADVPDFAEMEKKAGGPKTRRVRLRFDATSLAMIAQGVCPGTPRVVLLEFDPEGRSAIRVTDGTRNTLDQAFERCGVLARLTEEEAMRLGETKEEEDSDEDEPEAAPEPKEPIGVEQ